MTPSQLAHYHVATIVVSLAHSHRVIATLAVVLGVFFLRGGFQLVVRRGGWRSRRRRSGSFSITRCGPGPLKGIRGKIERMRSGEKIHVQFCRLTSGVIGDNGLQVGALSPLLAAAAIGSRGSYICHLLAFVQHGLGKINAFHGVGLEGVGDRS